MLNNILESKVISILKDNEVDPRHNNIGFKINNSSFYKSMILNYSLGFGESYMKGDWDCSNLEELFFRLFSKKNIRSETLITIFLNNSLSRFYNFQSKKRSHLVNEQHYDIGIELYEKMLGDSMVYTCGYWKEAKTLEKAQEDKLDIICQKLQLQPGMQLLDVGCGFGSFMEFAAKKYGVKCVGVTLSKDQCEYAKNKCRDLPVEVKYCDYRDIQGKFDRIVSIGMFEAVGYKNYSVFMKKMNELLNEDGVFLLHTIGNNVSRFRGDPWSNKYIFPNGMLPSLKQIGESIEENFILEDLHNFGPDYHKTLMAWNERFQASWEGLNRSHPHKYDHVFKRMWELYLQAFAGGFRARRWQLWQLILTKKGSSTHQFRRDLF